MRFASSVKKFYIFSSFTESDYLVLKIDCRKRENSKSGSSPACSFTIFKGQTDIYYEYLKTLNEEEQTFMYLSQVFSKSNLCHYLNLWFFPMTSHFYNYDVMFDGIGTNSIFQTRNNHRMKLFSCDFCYERVFKFVVQCYCYIKISYIHIKF